MTTRRATRAVFQAIFALALWLMNSFPGGRPLSAQTNWPEFRGPAGNGHATAQHLPTKFNETDNVRWKTALSGRAWSSPVIWGNQLWVTTATVDGSTMSAVGLDKQTGEILHEVRVFDVANPREIHFTNTYASGTPVIEEDRLYVHFGSYGTACLHTDSGQILWQRQDLPCHHWRGPGSSPILDGDKLIFHLDGYDYQYAIAVNKRTGETIWRTPRSHDYHSDNGDHKKAYGTPLVITAGGRRQLISPTAKGTVSLDPKTGEELWFVGWEQHSTACRPVFENGLVFLTSGFPKAERFSVDPTGTGDVTKTHVVWHSRRGIPSKPSPLWVDGLLYLVHDSGILHCMDASNGDTVWQKRLGGSFSSSPLSADGKIYLLSREGAAIVIAPGREYRELAVNQFNSGFEAAAAVSDNALFLRTTTHLYRIESDQVGQTPPPERSQKSSQKGSQESSPRGSSERDQ